MPIARIALAVSLFSLSTAYAQTTRTFQLTSVPNPAALNEVEGILTASPITVKAARPVGLRVTVPEFAVTGEDITVHVTPTERIRQAVRVVITTETGALAEARVLRPTGATMTTEINALPPGAYSIDVTGTSPSSPYAPVSSPILIWETPDP